jgi:DNA helicase-2/ATP-dependent DNA helicase PcrA
VLTEAVERKLRRCEDCPSTLDEGLYERLRDWRGRTAREQGLPGYCVFTDATLLAIAEQQPGSLPELGQISGVGRAKLDKYGEAVLSLCAGADPSGIEAHLEPNAASPSGETSGDTSGQGDQGDISDLWGEPTPAVNPVEDSPEK